MQASGTLTGIKPILDAVDKEYSGITTDATH
jgi:hypothetical protein